MKFLLDENFPKSATDLLEDNGFDWVDPRGTELEGATDIALIEYAKSIGAVLLTTDRDFFHTLRHSHPHHAGLIVIALKQPNREAIVSRLKWLFMTVGESEISGRAFQLRDASWIAFPPIEVG